MLILFLGYGEGDFLGLDADFIGFINALVDLTLRGFQVFG